MTNLGAAALRYAEHGLPVFPCRPRDKEPITEHGFHDASADPVEVTAWWRKNPNANIGMPTAGYLVLDLDPRNGGPADRDEFIEQFGPIPETAEAITGGGGRHIFFRNPGGDIPTVLAPGIDIKSTGGYVIVAPSIHPDTGRAYQWDGLKGAAGLLNSAEVPAWLLERLRAAAGKSNGTVPRELPEIISDGTRHHTIVSLAGTLRHRGLPVEAAFAACRALRFESPVSDADIWERVNSVYELYKSTEDRSQPPRATSAGEPAIRAVGDIPSIRDFEGRSIDWAVEGLIAEGSVSMFSGESGSGKSTVAQAIAGCTFYGVEFAGREVKKRSVLILDKENPLPVVFERFDRLGMRDGVGFFYWGNWLSEEPPAPASPIVTEWVIGCDPKPLIVVDSLVAFLGADENSATEVRAFMQQLRQLANLGACVIVIHHSGKSETSQDYRGSSDFKASIDTGYVVSNIGDDPSKLERVRLRNFKARFQVAGELMLNFNGIEFVAEQGASPARTNEVLLRELLAENPSVTTRNFEILAARRGLGRNRAHTFLEAGICNQSITVEFGEHRARLHRLANSRVQGALL